VTDPFRPPRTDIDAPDVERGPAVKALVLGALVDFGGSTVASVLFFAMYGAYLGSTGGTAEDLGAAMDASQGQSPMQMLLNMVGCLFSVLGGYVCARVAKHAEYRLGAVLAVLTVALGYVIAGGDDGSGLLAIYSALTVAAVMVGSHLGAVRNRRDALGRAR
jgi:hypothetical protein